MTTGISTGEDIFLWKGTKKNARPKKRNLGIYSDSLNRLQALFLKIINPLCTSDKDDPTPPTPSMPSTPLMPSTPDVTTPSTTSTPSMPSNDTFFVPYNFFLVLTMLFSLMRKHLMNYTRVKAQTGFTFRIEKFKSILILMMKLQKYVQIYPEKFTKVKMVDLWTKKTSNKHSTLTGMGVMSK